MEQREGKILHSTLGNQAVGAWGLAKGEFITKSWCFYPAFFVILTFSRSSLSFSRSFPVVPRRRRLPQYLQSCIFSTSISVCSIRKTVDNEEGCPLHAIELSSLSRPPLPSRFCLLDRIFVVIDICIWNCIYAPCIYIFVLASGGRKNGQNGMKRRTG